MHTHLIAEKKIFTLGGLSDIFYFDTKQKPCAQQDLRDNDHHKLMMPIVFSCQYINRGLPLIHKIRKSSNKVLVVMPEPYLRKQNIMGTLVAQIMRLVKKQKNKNKTKKTHTKTKKTHTSITYVKKGSDESKWMERRFQGILIKYFLIKSKRFLSDKKVCHCLIIQ